MSNNKTVISMIIISNSWGGAEASMQNIAQSLNKEKFKVVLCVNSFLFERYKSIEGITLVDLGQFESNKHLAKLNSILKFHMRLVQVVKDHGVEIIHGRLENSLILIRTLLLRIKVPVVFTLSGDESRLFLSPKTLEHKLIRHSILNLLKSKTSVVTSVSHWLIKEFPENIRSMIRVIHNGVDTKLFKPLNDVDFDSKSILYVGRLVEKKGIEDLVVVAEKLPEYTFRFAGIGPLESLLQLPNTKHVGFVERNQLAKLYSESTLCVFPSYAEGMPMVGLEAMSCGKAVIASHHGFSDYIEDSIDGYIIEPGDINKITQLIIELSENHEKRTLIERNAMKKAQTYSITKTILNYEGLYHETIRSSKDPQSINPYQV